MKKIVFEIQGAPVPWQRAGVNTKSAHHFTKPKTRAYEARVKESFYNEARRLACMGKQASFAEHTAVCAEIYAYFPKPHKTKLRFVTKRPDADNISKAILDALNGVAYKDDSQIVALYVFKMWTNGEPHVRVELAEWTGAVDL